LKSPSKHTTITLYYLARPACLCHAKELFAYADVTLLSTHADRHGVDISVLFVILFIVLFVCTVTDFSAEDKASGVKFCTAVHRRPRQGISHFGELCSPRSPKSDESRVARALADSSDSDATFVEYRSAYGRRIGMCGYKAVPEDGRTCFFLLTVPSETNSLSHNVLD